MRKNTSTALKSDSVHPYMVFFPMDFVLHGFTAAVYFVYASPKTLVRPCPAKKILIYELDT